MLLEDFPGMIAKPGEQVIQCARSGVVSPHLKETRIGCPSLAGNETPGSQREKAAEVSGQVLHKSLGSYRRISSQTPALVRWPRHRPTGHDSVSDKMRP